MYQQENRSLADKFINCLACLASMCSGQNLEVRMSNPLSGGTTDVKCLQQFHCHLPCQACHCLQYTAANATLLQVCPMVLLAHHNLTRGKYMILCVCVCLSASPRQAFAYVFLYGIHLLNLFPFICYTQLYNDI